MSSRTVMQLYPGLQAGVPAQGLYLSHDLRRHAAAGRPYIYTNFVVSLDGRVAVRSQEAGALHIPPAIRNPLDWRLYQELSAQADVVLVSSGHARAMVRDASAYPFPFGVDSARSDLKRWRREHGLSDEPALLIVSSILDLPADELRRTFECEVIVATGEAIDDTAAARIESAGVRIVQAGAGKLVDGAALTSTLATLDFRLVYSVAGAGVMRELVRARVLDRLHLTQVHRLVGGTSFDSLLETEVLDPATDLTLAAHYLDTALAPGVMQTFSVFDVVDRARAS